MSGDYPLLWALFVPNKKKNKSNESGQQLLPQDSFFYFIKPSLSLITSYEMKIITVSMEKANSDFNLKKKGAFLGKTNC